MRGCFAFVYIYVRISVMLAQEDPMSLYIYPSRLCNMSQCVCRLHAPSCAIVKQCWDQDMAQGTIASPLWWPGAVQHGTHSKWRYNQFRHLPLLPVTQWCTTPSYVQPTFSYAVYVMWATLSTPGKQDYKICSDVHRCDTQLRNYTQLCLRPWPYPHYNIIPGYHIIVLIHFKSCSSEDLAF